MNGHSQYTGLKNVELKAQLKARGLTQQGNKAEMIQKLVHNDALLRAATPALEVRAATPATSASEVIAATPATPASEVLTAISGNILSTPKRRLPIPIPHTPSIHWMDITTLNPVETPNKRCRIQPPCTKERQHPLRTLERQHLPCTPEIQHPTCTLERQHPPRIPERQHPPER